jgi:hypothetical protein
MMANANTKPRFVSRAIVAVERRSGSSTLDGRGGKRVSLPGYFLA